MGCQSERLKDEIFNDNHVSANGKDGHLAQTSFF